MTNPETPDIAGLVVRDVAELPDRTSPDDWPDALLVTAEELTLIVERHFADALTSLTAQLAEVNELHDKLAASEARYQWAANELLACDYGDNDRAVIGWKVCGWRSDQYTIFGDTINEAIDAALAEAGEGN